MNMQRNELNPNNPFLPEPARIVRMYHLTQDVKFFQVRIADMEKALSFKYRPGQFAMVSVLSAGEAPFCISSTPSRPGLLEFCIRKVGTVTNTLFRLKENDIIGLRGPYGNGFPLEKMRDKDIIIVMGGLGVAPLRSVLLYCLDNRDQFRRVILLHGAKRPAEMIFREEFLALNQREDLECYLAVDADDTGKWTENIGVVTTLFPMIKDIDPKNTYSLVCGPPVMYKFVLKELVKLNMPKDQILMTLERRMKCGVGKCGHCAIDYIYTCLDGPVFTYWDVIHMRELI
ncbi:MAG: FAD/NAD(P)-binding protein [Candidatus Aminicenantes bacterium]|nr:FAD/NAD(P)-binding protein [Candidatus Aminicenantes bacterium]MDH5383456.1 FAD/NAD(P)-binding protein [Candidatus Aminicenantes bacterium]MDH5742141.1 FAD/NAD(P)-binding protein [Candidatus Aminicenantes bacterium]